MSPRLFFHQPRVSFERVGRISGLGSGGLTYIGEFHPKWSKFGTIFHQGFKKFQKNFKHFFFKGSTFLDL